MAAVLAWMDNDAERLVALLAAGYLLLLQRPWSATGDGLALLGFGVGAFAARAASIVAFNANSFVRSAIDEMSATMPSISVLAWPTSPIAARSRSLCSCATSDVWRDTASARPAASRQS